MGFFGIGPRIFLPAGIVAVLAGLATALRPEHLVMRFAPVLAFRIAGGLLIASGLALFLPANIAMERAVRAGRLETCGPFARCRNPMYFGWMCLILPGIAVFTRAWLVFLSPALALGLFFVLLPREEALLAERFGREYQEYKARVPALLPRLRPARANLRPGPP